MSIERAVVVLIFVILAIVLLAFLFHLLGVLI